MVAAEAYQEMPPEEAPLPPSKWRRVGLVASILAVTALCGAGVVSRANTLRGPVKVASPPSSNPAVVLDEYNDAGCLRNTGGTCAIWGCSGSRGQTDCVYWHQGMSSGHYCMCQEGFCAGLDGSCHPNNNNRLVGERVQIRNAQWMQHHIYISGWSVYLTSDAPDDSGLWNVYALPSFGGMPTSQFLITNVAYPEYALTVEETTETHHHRPTEIHHTPKVSWMYKMDAKFITTMNTAQWMTQAYTMSNMAFPTRYFTGRQLSWNVHLTHYYEAPGPQAMWVFDPPLMGPPPPPAQWR